MKKNCRSCVYLVYVASPRNIPYPFLTSKQPKGFYYRQWNRGARAHVVQRSVHHLRGRSGRRGLLEKTDAAKDGTDRHVELALRSGGVHSTPRGNKIVTKCTTSLAAGLSFKMLQNLFWGNKGVKTKDFVQKVPRGFTRGFFHAPTDSSHPPRLLSSNLGDIVCAELVVSVKCN